MDLSTIQNSLESFEKISELITENNLNDIIDAVARGLGASYITPLPAGGYRNNKTDRHYCYVIKDLKENLKHYRWLYNKLEDPRSKEVFLNLIRYRIIPYSKFLKDACDKEHEQYFDPDIVHCDADEVFVDCGGFIGDTVESFVRNYKDYKQIITFEPSLDNFHQCMQTASKYRNVFVKPFGVGKKEDRITFAQTGASSTFIIDGNNKQNVSEVKITSLDADIDEPVSFIKMDVEGYEIDALIGSKRHIQNENPKLAICVYHLPSDIWEIPRLIDTINPNYRFYLRHYNDVQSWETVLYAIPKAKINRADLWVGKVQPGVYAINGYFGCWTNQELTKDCGAVPFLFYKKYGCKAVMVGAKAEEYPYLNTCTKGMTMDFVPDKTVQARCQYVTDHYRDMDILTLYGPYPQYFAILETYRRLRPDGKVYLALDANSAWMDKIHWNEPGFLRFMDQCDVIATSCRRMQRLLSIKWPYKIEYIPNGFYNFLNCDLSVNLSAKENVILTVGRLGTRQKHTELLLEAYSMICRFIPGWSLRLVGGIESTFQPYINRYFERNPHLKDRVIFTGIIEDKQQLLSEYKKAKIFALPSTCEGGNPNVASEALFCGCYIITSDVDASEDMTNHGKCGKVFPISDLNQLSQLLVSVCSNPKLIEEGGKNALEYAPLVYDFDKIIGRLHYLFFAKE